MHKVYLLSFLSFYYFLLEQRFLLLTIQECTYPQIFHYGIGDPVYIPYERTTFEPPVLVPVSALETLAVGNFKGAEEEVSCMDVEDVDDGIGEVAEIEEEDVVTSQQLENGMAKLVFFLLFFTV